MHNPITLAIPEVDEIGQDPSIYVREKNKMENRKAKKDNSTQTTSISINSARGPVRSSSCGMSCREETWTIISRYDPQGSLDLPIAPLQLHT